MCSRPALLRWSADATVSSEPNLRTGVGFVTESAVAGVPALWEISQRASTERPVGVFAPSRLRRLLIVVLEAQGKRGGANSSSGARGAPGEGRPESPHVSYAVLGVGGAGFLVWALGWFALIPDNLSRLGWIFEVVGPLLIAAAMIMFVETVVRRIGRWAVALGVLGSVALGISTLPFGINPTNLESSGSVAFGYAAYGVGLVLGGVSLFLVLARKEADVEGFLRASRPECESGCLCQDNIHSSFASITVGAIGLLVWGIGFLGLSVDPSSSRFDWLLAVIGSLLVSVALTMHFDHFGSRFGRAAIVTGIASAYIWSLGYLLQAINPGALPTSSWYTYLFLCYGVGHLLTAVSLVLVARRKSALER
ncbi:unannotated protein [freshwater metagenome]|uniref:Unannotated protein n=1 Tax=freshwater metagenome TaxID=449393 RepID=A0A6J7JRU9_9ZZZZ